MRKRFSAAFALLVLSVSIHAQTGDSLKSYVTDEAVITGTRIETGKSSIPAAISVINRQNIESSNELNILPVLNRQVPGLFMEDRTVLGYGVGTASSGTISIRGISATPNSRVLVLVDGQPQFMGIFGHPINDQFNSIDIEKVEAIRGPSSILYGSNAMGGTINILTRRLQDNGIHFASRAAYGSFQSLIYSGSVGLKKNSYSLFGSVNYASTDGHRTDGDDNFKNISGFIKGTGSLSRGIELKLDANITNAQFHDPGKTSQPLKGSYYNYLRGRSALSVENSFNKISGALRAFYSYGQHDLYDGWNSYDYISGITLYQNYTLKEKNTITAGVDYKHYGGEGSNDKMPAFARKGLSVTHTADETEFYGLMQLRPVDKFSLYMGYRTGYSSIFGWQGIPQFGLTFSPDEVSVIKASAGKSFRSPTIVDLFLFPVSNDKLLPEQTWSWEGGYSRSFFGNIIYSEITFFYTKGDNLIEEIQAGLLRQKKNSGSFIHKGIEAEIKLKPGSRVSIYSNYSYLKTGKPVLYAPRHLLNLQGEYSNGLIVLNAGIKYVHGLYSNLTTLRSENYLLFNSVLSVHISDRISLFAKGDNIFNKKYQINEGYPMPGAVWQAGIKVNN